MRMRSTAQHLGNSAQKREERLSCVARQPILNLRGKAHGYELLFWNGRESEIGTKGNMATCAMLDNTVVFGLKELTRGLPAFVNCTADSLTGEWVNVLPPQLTVLELPAATEPTAQLLTACRNLKASGFRLALTDFTGEPDSLQLAALADYIKVDITRVDAGRRHMLFEWRQSSPVFLVAQNVETQEQYGQLRKEGFKLFQGYYFCRPEPLDKHKIPSNRMAHLKILEKLQNEPADLPHLSQLVMCDASLTYRLLRLVNSPVCAVRQEVTSVQTAIMLLGEATFRRIAMLAIASDCNAGQSEEILRMAFERGRFCELAANLCGLDPGEQYLIGMVSLFPAMLRVLMEDLICLLPLRAAAREALLGREIPESLLLRWVVCQEYGNWAECNAIVRSRGLDHDQIMRCHDAAVAWAAAALRPNA